MFFFFSYDTLFRKHFYFLYLRFLYADYPFSDVMCSAIFVHKRKKKKIYNIIILFVVSFWSSKT